MVENEYLIRSLTSDIWSLHNRMQSNMEDISRLEQAKFNILNEQDELAIQKRLVFEPELSPGTWTGKHSTEFLNIRSDIEQAYTNIINGRVESLLERITSEISRLQNVNASLSHSLESKQSQIDSMNNN
ncbi:YwqH-like family protein [Halobacillus naozhouensis]|uniref:DUF5082 family protein n=1 Tax=Halobacillus naozhouensis TaxID=554880 RepID=A0ABY8IX54_9BACI|nr:DUF5082 family protein [Halobacillus naozhouensis]WFT74808.1 DUF5082 family protein [Halobacillus naozhouensis]